MAKIKNVSGEVVFPALLGGVRVARNQVVECPADLVYPHTVSGWWESADDPAVAAESVGRQAEEHAVAAERGDDDAEPVEVRLPAVSEPKAIWEATATAAGVPADDVESATKAELIDLTTAALSDDGGNNA